MNKEYLINERPVKALLLFAMPMIIGNLFQQFYTMVDSVVVGKFVGENALAAVGASYSLTTVFISIAIGGGVGASVITGLYFGSRSYDKMKLSIRTALITFLALSIILASAGLVFSRQIMIALNTPDEILSQATEYLNIYFLGLPFLFMYNILSSMFNALGRSKIPLYLLIFSSIFNVVLDIFMVCELHMGIAGVAWATLIAQGISAIMAFILFLREMRMFKLAEDTISNMPFYSRAELGNMARIALPSIFQQSTVSIGMMLVQSVVNSFGAEMLAGFSAAMRIESICVVPMAAMGNVMSSYTAQNIGAKKFDRISKGYNTGYFIVFAFAAIIAFALELFHTSLINLFLEEDASAIALETGVGYLKFCGWFFVMIGLKMITDGVLRGSGDMKMFTIANLVNLGIRVLLSFALAPTVGISIVWIAVPIGWTVNYIISFIEYRTGRWKKLHTDE